MKVLFLAVSAALLLSACTAPSTNREITNTNNNANKTTETKVASITEAEAVAKEKEVWASLEKKDYNAFAALLADDFIYVTGDGAHDKADTVKAINGLSFSNLVMSDWKFVPVGKTAGIVTFSVRADASMNGQTMKTNTRESSVWVNRGGKLLAVYHQDTTVMTTPPPPPPKAGPSPAASAAAATPAAMTSDVEANEKAVWAALAAKQWSNFGSYLANDFIEVEADAVYDKAGSIKGVEAVDFAKTTLSGWKTVKIDDEAGLVTYVAKDPSMKPDTWYHTSVWSARDGKWLVVFHQGTTQAPAQPPQKATK